jgi:hypothetical protein
MYARSSAHAPFLLVIGFPQFGNDLFGTITLLRHAGLLLESV